MLKANISVVAFNANKYHHFYRGLILTATVCASTVSLATEWYWTMDGGGTWDEGNWWVDSEGNKPAIGEPGIGDSAFLVLPYRFGGEQPVNVFYRSEINPTLQSVAIESGNVLYQTYTSYIDPAYTNLTTNYEYIGGSPYTYVPPPDYFFPGFPAEIYPQGEHVQNIGINRVNDNLVIGGTAGSTGRYLLDDAADGYFGTLSVGNIEILGDQGHGSFVQQGGVHEVESTLIIGHQETATGEYRMTDGSLDVAVEILGSSGNGEFTQLGGDHSVSNLRIGQLSGGEGLYTQNGGSLAAGSEIIGGAGQGTFEHNAGTHSANNLELGAEAGGNGTYNLNGGTLDVAGNTQVGGLGEGVFTQTGGTHNAGNLTIAAQSGSSGTYSLSGTGTLNVADSLVMDASGVASFVQNGGVTNVGSVLQRGEMTIGGLFGEYTLNDGLLNVIGQSIIRPNGSFTQAGGEFRSTLLTLRGGVTHNMDGGILKLGQWDVDGYVNQTGGDATVGFTFTVGTTLYLTSTPPRQYILEDTGAVPAPSFTVNGTGIIGDQHVGIFTQRGADSLATFNNLVVGGGNMTFPGYTGTYELEDGTLDVNGQETIGSTSSGYFNQTGGKNNANGDMVVGDESFGQYDLQNAVLDVDANMTIGRFGHGTVLNSAGNHIIGGDLLLGTEDSGSGEYTLSNLGVLEVHGNEVIGFAGSSTFDHNLGLNWVNNNLTIDNASSYRQLDGITHVGKDLIVRALSSYSLSNDAKLEVGGNAFFNGTLRNDSIFTVGGNLTLGEGDLNNNAELTVTGDLDSSSGVFSQLDGVHTVHGNAQVNGYNQSGGDFLIDGNLDSGSYTMSGGRLTSATHDAGHFVQNGGVHIVSGEMSISGTATIGGTGSLTAGNISNGGTFTLAGAAIVTAAGGIDNFDTFNLTGAGKKKTVDAALNNKSSAINVSTTIAEFKKAVVNEASEFRASTFYIDTSVVDFYGNVTNENFYTPGSGFDPRFSFFVIDNSLVTFHDVFTNESVLHITDSVVHFLGDYEGYDAFITDPSDIYFTNLNIHEQGTIQAGPGDRFFVEGDFMNSSQENIIWDTDAASLIFDGTGVQNFYLAGADFGVDALGYQNNFAWGELVIGSGIDLNIWDGNTEEGAALYVGLLGLAGGVDTGSLLIDYILSDYNIYYDPTRPENSYLQGLTYALNGEGFLMPSTVPVPPAVWLFGSGLLGLICIARRKKTNV